MESNKLVGFIIDGTYDTLPDKNIIKLFGRLKDGRSFVLETTYEPYFYIEKEKFEEFKEHLKEINEIKRIEETDFKTPQGKEVVKIVTHFPQQVKIVREILKDKGIKTYEADVKFVNRFLIDHNIRGFIEIVGEGEKDNNYNVDLVFRNAKINSWTNKDNINLRIVAIDIETDKKAKDLYCISFYSNDGFKKVLMLGNIEKNPGYIESVLSERDLIKRFVEVINELDPDVITGWNLIDFDLKIIKEKAKQYNLPLSIGRDKSNLRLRIYQDFMRESEGKATGRFVIDGINLMKLSFIDLEEYSLDYVASHFLGDGKLLKGDLRFEEIENLFVKDKLKLAEYNLKDSELVIRILEKSEAVDLAVEKSKITGLLLPEVKGSVSSFDSLYLRYLKNIKVVAPTLEVKEREARISGGYVKEPVPGLYNNVAVLDFKSLYPSIIRTFNVEPLSYVKDCEGDVIKAPNGACFKKEYGPLPIIIEEIFQERQKAKKAGDKIRSYALKILMNSFFGVLANPACRFYNREVADAITSFGRFIINLTAKNVEDKGYKVIYSDTDSIFVLTNEKEYEKAVEIAKKLEKEINEFYKEYVKKEYGMKSFLEIEYEKVYYKLFMPRLRAKDERGGAKKRYAGLLIKDGKYDIELVGLEAVRRDWTDLAREFQVKLLEGLFFEKDLKQIIKEYIDDLLQGKYDDKLVYVKSIRKPLEMYVKTTPPHVKAARKIPNGFRGKLIKYVMTVQGPEPLGYVKNKIDYQHYIEKQLKPIAQVILDIVNLDFDEIVNGGKQTSLQQFFKKSK